MPTTSLEPRNLPQQRFCIPRFVEKSNCEFLQKSRLQEGIALPSLFIISSPTTIRLERESDDVRVCFWYRIREVSK